jgi:hypothetical protein
MSAAPLALANPAAARGAINEMEIANHAKTGVCSEEDLT